MPRFRGVHLPSAVPGRLWLHSMPGRYEPLNDAWAEVRRLGVSRIVCLAPFLEIREKSPEYAKAIEGRDLPCDVRRCLYATIRDQMTMKHSGNLSPRPPILSLLVRASWYTVEQVSDGQACSQSRC